MRKPNGIFITGTDTGIGKTIISAALLCVLKSTGLDAVYMKPAQTGCRQKSARLIAPDLEFVLSYSGICPSAGERKLMAPYCFRMPCSPHLAATLEKRNIRLSKIIKSFAGLKRRHDFIIVEGAGGILTPLSRQLSMLDLMKALSLPVIVVARPGLGTINHTLLTLRELKHAGLNVLGLILNCSLNAKPGLIETSNKDTIECRGKTRIICEFPFLGKLNRTTAARQLFQKTALESFSFFIKALIEPQAQRSRRAGINKNSASSATRR